MTFEQWFDRQNLGAHLRLDLEVAFRGIAEEAWEAAFELGENVACEGAYDDGHREGYREGKDSTEEEVEKAYKDGHSEGYKEGLSFRMEDFV